MLTFQRPRKKGQSSIEFLIIVVAVMAIFIAFLSIFQQNLRLRTDEQRDAAFLELALTVQNEIAIAASASDGYRREFFIPNEILGTTYTISIVDGDTVYLISDNERHAMSLSVQEVVGDVQKETNVIEKVDGEVLLNQP